ncbi:tRNA (adenosine(37)-N6)-threonylcarbamoyltransferase complex ATPase subunit type 1 TsaE [Pedobacter metabolipauper]|uniref:tRNA threonylcarbamoyladenosine biosynthesis protein TsaE n=1 Tax=Pedobacter metabolipauper TaxID=425513 RepID=A0A4R6SW02_9SPHI|nr:tRNA (adenosine(37)-N6)-threonylcarbamoyltransferase complex ATPase subunit type 1 TsaE [Pedobacter metabolipauper]TDQ09581.1 tRNA threonylcarbamoyladenosine biosynthesis protein TsaE [Pedobacter metabolipauper]
MKIKLNGLHDLDEATSTILNFAGQGTFFVFEGDMGAGKTTLIKALSKALGVKELVSSPTFSIVNEYDANGSTIYHFDFYRIKSLQEAYDIGYEEYFYSGHICFIEWPERVLELLPDQYIKIELSTLSENERMITLSKI